MNGRYGVGWLHVLLFFLRLGIRWKDARFIFDHGMNMMAYGLCLSQAFCTYVEQGLACTNMGCIVYRYTIRLEKIEASPRHYI